MAERQFTQIEQLKQELLNLGYHQFQIDSLVREIAHTSRVDKLSPEEIVRLTEALEDHLKFARKCHNNY